MGFPLIVLQSHCVDNEQVCPNIRLKSVRKNSSLNSSICQIIRLRSQTKDCGSDGYSRKDTEMQSKIKVLSLNIWGLVGISKNRQERINAFAEHLAFREVDFDFVFLQEVWSQADYQKLVDATKLILPYSHYFYSGVTGSGVCIFSKWPIIDIFAYKYNLNGYAHKIYHGDWFGGKV